MIRRTRLLLITAMFALLAGGSVFACKVPVFRFALERWPADNYRMVAITDGESNDETSNAIAALEELSKSPANVEVEVVNLRQLTDAELWQVEGLESTDDAPLLQVFFPERDGQRKLCWTGKLTAANVSAWLDSPLRSQITNDIQSGVSAVWVIVEGPDQGANQQLMLDLNAALAAASKQVAIPAGVIERKDASRYLAANQGASMDDVLRSDLPLRIEFSIRTLEHGSQDELAMAAMIAAFADLKDAPFVFPVFGRGRMIEPLPVKQFESTSVVGACKYMVGECSCVVKALNPGVDLMLNTDWQDKLGEEIVMVVSAVQTEPMQLEIPLGSIAEAFEEQKRVPDDSSGAIIVESPEVDHSMTWMLVVAILALGILVWFKLRSRSGQT